MDGPKRTPLNNKQVADLFRSIGDLLQILGESRFVVIAYQNAARTIDGIEVDINAVAAEGGLEDLPKIGKAIAEKIGTLLETGALPYYDQLAAQVPAGVVAMMQVPDVGPKTVQRLWKELDITSVAAMQAAAQGGKLRGLKGFGAKTEERILKSIELLKRRSDDHTPIGVSRPLSESLAQALEAEIPSGTLDRVEIVGSLRRWRETTGEIRLLAVCDAPQRAIELFESLPQAVALLESGAMQTSVSLTNGMRATLRVVEADHWGVALCHATGNQAHFAALGELALSKGWRLDESGLTAQSRSAGTNGETPDQSGSEDQQQFFESEESLYDFIGLQWTPPELREGDGEVAAAQAQGLPQLIAADEILGELHGHTTWSDGKASVVEMGEAARGKGYRYWAVTDHSVGLGVTQGVDAEALLAQRREIDAANERYVEEGIDFRLFQGTEVEILGDGQLGLPDDVLATLDIVVASIHIGLRQERERITERCLKAIHNPNVDILGHPTGRLLGRRAPSEIDLERIMRSCAATGTALEINANPARLDLSADHARQAVKLGCKIVINSDAHSVGQLDLMPYGVHTARRGWLRADDVLNTRRLDELLGLLKRNRPGRCTK
jgi:DNA polymerase (family 10)